MSAGDESAGGAGGSMGVDPRLAPSVPQMNERTAAGGDDVPHTLVSHVGAARALMLWRESKRHVFRGAEERSFARIHP